MLLAHYWKEDASSRQDVSTVAVLKNHTFAMLPVASAVMVESIEPLTSSGRNPNGYTVALLAHGRLRMG